MIEYIPVHRNLYPRILQTTRGWALVRHLRSRSRPVRLPPTSLAGGGELMGIYIRLTPGLKVRVSGRGLRWAIGPRAARVHADG